MADEILSHRLLGESLNEVRCRDKGLWPHRRHKFKRISPWDRRIHVSVNGNIDWAFTFARQPLPARGRAHPPAFPRRPFPPPAPGHTLRHVNEPRRWLVLGHSGTRGEGLDGAPPWPVLLEQLLAKAGDDVRITAVDVFPNGPKAADYALRRVAEFEPDAVLLSLNAYPCAVPVVSERVRTRFGARIQRLYARAEAAWQRRTSRKRAPAVIERAVRAVAQRLVGAEPMVTVAATAETYSLILERLTALEGPRPVVIAEVPFSAVLRRTHPGATPRVRKLQALVRPVADARHIDWIDLGEELAGAADGDLWQTDGVHLSANGNVLYADVLARRLAGG